MELKGYDDEYAAMCYLFTLAKEKLDSEEVTAEKVV
jgi:hypothetical protein